VNDHPPARTKRRKRSAGEARDEGLAAARGLLLSGGPAAVTLANVGQAIGMSHTNVIHHFGSAAGLQTALMESMIRDLAGALGDAVSQIHTDAAAPSMLVDRVFDAFGEGGAGQLAAWLVLAREFDHLEPVRQAVLDLVTAVKERAPDVPDRDARIRAIVLLIAICAFGDAVIGPHLRAMLGQDDETARRLVAQILPLLIA
jgi:AcrR family transcriptional regulator